MHLTLLTVTLVLAQIDAPPAPPFGAAATVRANRDIAQAAREFRRTVYETYRTDREAFDLRWSAGDELWRRWVALEQPAAHREAVFTWFVESRRLAATGDRGELPFLPELPEPTLPATIESYAAPATEFETVRPTDDAPSLTPPAEEEAIPEAAPTAGDSSAPAGADAEQPMSKQLRAVVESLLSGSSQQPASGK
jgi:hypothetical protein